MNNLQSDVIIEAPPGYRRFEIAWLRSRRFISHLPTEADWKKLLEYQDENNLAHQFKEFLPTELLDIYGPEAITIIKRNKKILYEYLREFEPLLQIILNEVILSSIYEENNSTIEEKKIIASRAINFFYQKPLQKVEREIKKLEHLLRINEWKRKPMAADEITDKEIARAKEFPLRDLLKLNRAGFALCPFHNEKTASFKIYDDNRWHCFGCQANGDTIDYVMKTENIDFLSAVRKILQK